jgi:WD40 repeat protein
MEIARIINLDRELKKIKSLESSKLMLVHTDNSFKLVTPNEDFKVTSNFKLAKIAKLKTGDNRLDISNDSKLIAIANKKTKNIEVVNFKEKDILFDIDWHRGEVESLKFDIQNRYLATGGQDGKVVIWSLDTEDILYSLKPHKDFVTAVQFSKDGNFFASASYDRTINVTNLKYIDKSFTLKGIHLSAINILYFISRNRLLVIDRSGKIAIYDYIKKKFLHVLETPKAEIYSVTFLFNYHFMLLLDKFGKIHLYDLNKYKKLKQNFLTIKDKIVDITYLSQNGHLCIATNKSVIFYNTKDDEKKLKNFLSIGHFAQGYKLLENNPFLEYSPFSQELENIWNDTNNQALEHLNNLFIEKAKDTFTPFLSVNQKREYITKLLGDFSDIDKFKYNIKTQNYHVVYTMVNQYPNLKNTKIFKVIEADFEARLNRAKELIFEGYDNIDKQISDLLSSYKAIPSKLALIKELMANKNTLKLFNSHLIKKDWKNCFILVEQYPFIKDLSEYQKLISIAKALYEKILKLLEHSNIKEAKKLIEELENFKDYKENIKYIKEKVDNISKFKDLYQYKEYSEMIEFVQKHPFLEKQPEYKRFDKKWRDTRIEAIKIARTGKVIPVIAIFEDFTQIKSKLSTIGHIISSTHIHKFMKLENNLSILIPKIKRYLDIFGTTNELTHYFEYYEDKYHENISKNFDTIKFKGYENYANYQNQN